MKRLFFIVALFLISLPSIFAQSDLSEVDYNKNITSASVGILVSGFDFNFDNNNPFFYKFPSKIFISQNYTYERFLFKSENRAFSSVWVKLGIGEIFYNNTNKNAENNFHINVSLTSLTGRHKSNHLEYSLGFVVLYDNGNYENDLMYYYTFPSTAKPQLSNYIYYHPIISFGYRYQKPNGHFVFRTGFSSLEAFYIGIGYLI